MIEHMNLRERKGKSRISKSVDYARSSDRFPTSHSTARALHSARPKTKKKFKIGFFKPAHARKGRTEGQQKAIRIAKRAGIILSLTLLFGLLLGTLLLIGVVSAFSQDLPNIDKVLEEKSLGGKATVIVDRNGKELYKLQGDIVAEKKTLSDIPDKLKWAFLSIEDKNFYEHEGLDMFGLARALLCQARTRGDANCGGGSSITQQLIKNVTGYNERSLKRKAQEAILAMNIEKEYSKDYILEYYLNVVPMGGRLVGVGAGGKYLFGKENLYDLTLAEIAYLAAIPNQPTVLSPWGKQRYNQQASIQRAELVLDKMLENRARSGVTREEIEEAKAQLPFVTFLAEDINIRAPHYTDHVIFLLNEMYKNKLSEVYPEGIPEDAVGSDYLKDKGYKVVTAVDLEMQTLLEDKIKTSIDSPDFQSKIGAQNGAAVAMDPLNGDVLAMVGSRDYNASSSDPRFRPKFNAALAPRSLGSTMKPVLYLTAIINGYHPSTLVPDLPINQAAPGAVQEYYPRNYSGDWGGLGEYVTMRVGLSRSLNIPAVSTLNMVGLDKYIDTYVKLNGWEGFRGEALGPSAVLGAANMPLLEQVHAYSTMAANGVYHESRFILWIEDADENIVYDNRQNDGRRVVEEKYMFIINDMNKRYWLCDASLSYSDDLLKAISQSMDFGCKTGTSDNNTGAPGDASFIGYTPTFVLGMWAGNDDGANASPLNGGATGEDVYKLMYKPFLAEYAPNIPKTITSFYPDPNNKNILPQGVRIVQICALTGNAVSELCPEDQIISEFVADPDLPRDETFMKKVWVTQCGDKVKLARDIDKLLGLAQEQVFFYYDFGPLQNSYIDYLTKNNLLPPSETCEIPRNVDPPKIDITAPIAGTKVKQGETLKITISVTSDAPLQKVEVFLNGIAQKTSTAPPYEITITLPNTAPIGPNEITVIATDTRGRNGGETQLKRSFEVIPLAEPTQKPTIPSVVVTSAPTPTPKP